MRTTTAGELAVLAANERQVTYRVKVENGSGTMIDLTSWVHHLTWDLDIDQPVSGATVYFIRADGATQSLSPLRTDSSLNVEDDLVTFSAQVYPGRTLTIEVATTAIAAAIVAGDYKLMFSGKIDAVNFDDNPIAAICRDAGGLLVDRYTGANWLGSGPIAGSGTVSKILDAGVFSTSQAGAIEDGDIITVDGVDYVVSDFDGTTGCRLSGTYDFTFSGRPFTISRNYRTFQIYGSTPGTGTVNSAFGAATFSTSQAGKIADGYTITVLDVEYTITAFDGTTHATLKPGIPSFGAVAFTINAAEVELVMQEILDDAVDDGPLPIAVPLNTPVSPAFLITEYKQQNQPVMTALLELAGVPGWDVRYWFDETSGTFKLTLRDPNRTKTVPDYTFGPNAYFKVSRLAIDRTKVRNTFEITYFDRTLKSRRKLSTSDSTSQLQFGLQYMRDDEPDGSPINSVVEATAKIEAMLADLKDPKAEQEIETHFFWPAELGDLYRHSPNAVHYNTNQDFAVVRIEHELGPGNHRTRLLTRASPAARHVGWLPPPRPTPLPVTAPVIHAVTGLTLVDPITARLTLNVGVPGLDIDPASVLGASIEPRGVTLAQLASERAMAHKSTGTSIPNTALTSVQLDTDDYLSSGITRVGSKLVVASAGDYSVTGYVVWDANATGNRLLELFRKDVFGTTLFTRRVTGPAISWTTPAGTVGNEMVIAFVTQMAPGESFAMNAYQDSGGARNIVLAYLEVIGING